VGQREQVAAGGGPRDAGPLRRQRRVQALALGVEALQHRHALGHALDEIRLCDRHGRIMPANQPLRGDRARVAMIAQATATGLARGRRRA
jgi:hypothetical protein